MINKFYQVIIRKGFPQTVITVVLNLYLYGKVIFKINLTFIGPCIFNIFSEYNQQDVTFLKFLYFCKMLYMFHTVLPSITRSTKLHIQRQTVTASQASSNGLTNAWCCMCSFVLLVMDGKTVWNIFFYLSN